MKKVKFSPLEQEILDGMEQNGEYVWNQNPDTVNKYIKPLKDLVWKGLIDRKATYANIFIPTALGKAAIEWNKSVEIFA